MSTNSTRDLANMLGTGAAVRLHGGEQREIEDKTRRNWSKVVEPEEDLVEVAGMLRDFAKGSRLIKVYLNNYYDEHTLKSTERFKALVKF